MKRLFVIIVALFVGFAYGANENVPTSKKFVDDALAQKQPKFDGLGNDKLMLYSNTTDGGVASRDIVTTLGSSTSANTVPTVGAINTGLNTKQDTLNGDAGWVVENTGIAGAVTQKPIYSATNNYSNALVEVETLNNAVINAVNSELTVVPGVGWTINTAANLNLLPTPQTYNDVPPGGYTRLEYLRSYNYAYIDTGIIPNLNFSIEVRAIKQARQSLFGARGYNLSGNDTNHNYFYLGYQDDHRNMLPNTIDNSLPHLWGYKNGKIFCDDIQVVPTYIGNNIPNNTLFLFARNYTTLDWGAHSIYYAKLWNDRNELVFNGIPARRNSDNALGMYDTVSGTFFTNAGTGTFIAGPVVTNP